MPNGGKSRQKCCHFDPILQPELIPLSSVNKCDIRGADGGVTHTPVMSLTPESTATLGMRKKTNSLIPHSSENLVINLLLKGNLIPLL